MKRNFGVLLGAVLCFGFFFWLGKALPGFFGASDESFHGSSGPKVAGNTIKAPDNADVVRTAIWREVAEPNSVGDLFDTIYNTGLRDFLQKPMLRDAIANRFTRAYPEDNNVQYKHKLMNELVSRLGILKVLNDNFSPLNKHDNPEALLKFYQQVLLNPQENWIVKRQALQNLSPWMPGLSIAERDKILAAQDPRAIALANKTERQILTEALSTNAY